MQLTDPLAYNWV